MYNIYTSFADVYLFLWKFSFFFIYTSYTTTFSFHPTTSYTPFFRVSFFVSYMLSFFWLPFFIITFFFFSSSQFPTFRLMYMYGCPFPLKLFLGTPLYPYTLLLHPLTTRHIRSRTIFKTYVFY